LNFFVRFFEKYSKPNLITIRSVGTEVYHVDGRTYRRDEAKQSHFTVLRTRLKIQHNWLLH